MYTHHAPTHQWPLALKTTRTGRHWLRRSCRRSGAKAIMSTCNACVVMAWSMAWHGMALHCAALHCTVNHHMMTSDKLTHRTPPISMVPSLSHLNPTAKVHPPINPTHLFAIPLKGCHKACFCYGRKHGLWGQAFVGHGSKLSNSHGLGSLETVTDCRQWLVGALQVGASSSW